MPKIKLGQSKNQIAWASGAFVAAIAFLVVVGCGRPPEDGDPRPRVVATTGMVADLARAVGGEHVDVRALMPPGVDPHLFKPSEGDVRALGQADLVLYNGLMLEGKMGSILEKMGRRRPVVAVAEVVPGDRLLEARDYPGQYDPHVWFDVESWSLTVEPVVAALSGLLPEHAAGFDRRGQALRAELRDLDAWVAERVAEVPPERRVLITAHDAFGYFGRRYGVEVVGLQGISTATEAGLDDVERLVDRIVDERIPAMFVETSVPRRSIEAVREACRARGHDVAIGGQLFSDSMGPPGTVEGTYVGMVRHNVETIVEALR